MDARLPRKTPTYFVHDNGMIMPATSNRENFVQALTYIPADDDIFISTYPKCGTTWAQCILYLMKNRGEPLKSGQNINTFIPHLECDGKKAVEQLSRPRIIKTHLPYQLVPKNINAKYIYIARNPKDCCVSYYHHTKGFGKYYHFEDGTFDDYFELFLSGTVDFCDYFDNLLSWVAHKNDPNVLFLLYEEMKSDIKECIQKIGHFLGGDFIQVSGDPLLLDNIIRNSSFKVMKATPSMWSSERPKQFGEFIRKGQVGDWRSHFSKEQSTRLDKKFRIKLSGTTAEQLWDDYDCLE